MRFLKYMFVAMMLTGCASMNPFGGKSGNLTEVSVYTPPGMTQEQIQQKSLVAAAITTVNVGYDKFVVVSDEEWRKQGLTGLRKETNQKLAPKGEPTTSVNIRMYKAGENAPASAVDAKSLITQSGSVVQ